MNMFEVVATLIIVALFGAVILAGYVDCMSIIQEWNAEKKEKEAEIRKMKAEEEREARAREKSRREALWNLLLQPVTREVKK